MTSQPRTVGTESRTVTNLKGKTYEEALEAVKLPLKLHPLQTMDTKAQVAGFRAVVREDTSQTLAVVGSRYQMVSHDQGMEATLGLLHKNGWVFKKATLERHGAWAFVEGLNPEVNLGTGKDQLFPRVTLVNSVDMRSSLRLTFGIYRLVCSNGMVAAAPGYEVHNLSFRAMHAGSSAGDVLARIGHGFMGQVNARVEQLRELGKVIRGLLNQTVPMELAERFAVKMAGKSFKDRILNLFLKGRGQDGSRTAYSLYNGYTEWLTHEAKGGVYLKDLRAKQAVLLLQDPKALKALPKVEA